MSDEYKDALPYTPSPSRPTRRGGTYTEMRTGTLGPAPVTLAQTIDPEKVEALARGYAEGLGSGVLKYPEAAGRSLFGDGTYRENLSRIHALNRDLSQRYPGQFYGGNLAGSATLGALTGGGGVYLNMAKGALQGGLSGYTANEGELFDKQSLIDAGKGIGFGTLAGLGSGMVTKGAETLGNIFVKDAMKASSNIPKTIGEELKAAAHLPLAERNAIVRKYGYKNITDYNKNGSSSLVNPDLQTLTEKEVRDAFINIPKNGPPAVGPGYMLGSGFRSAADTAKELAVPVLGTAAGMYLGGKGADFLGLDPATGQLIGGMVGGGITLSEAKRQVAAKAAKGMLDAAGAQVLMRPNVVPRVSNIIRGAASGVAVPVIQYGPTSTVNSKGKDDYEGAEPY